MKDICQIYLPSFGRSYANNSLSKIIQILPMLAKHQIKGIWLTAMWLSGGYDNGFDIVDYIIDSKYGTEDELSELITIAHQLGLEVGCDIVPNHVSDKHYLARNCLNGVSGYEDCLYVVTADQAKHLADAGVPSFFGAKAYSDITTENGGVKYVRSTFCDYHQLNLNWNSKVVQNYFRELMLKLQNRGFDFFRIDCGMMLLEDISKADSKNPLACMDAQKSVDIFMSMANTNSIKMFFEWFDSKNTKPLDKYNNCYAVDCEYVMTGGYHLISDYTKHIHNLANNKKIVPLLGCHDQMPEANRYGLSNILNEMNHVFKSTKFDYRFIDLITIVSGKNDASCPTDEDRKYDADLNNPNKRYLSRLAIAPIIDTLF